MHKDLKSNENDFVKLGVCKNSKAELNQTFFKGKSYFFF